MGYNKNLPTIDILVRLAIVIVIVVLVVRVFNVKETFATACGLDLNRKGTGVCRIDKPCHCKKSPGYCNCKPANFGPKLGCSGCNKTPVGKFVPRETCQQKRICCSQYPDMYSECQTDPFQWSSIRYTTGPEKRLISN